jgi:hypothetical protein
MMLYILLYFYLHLPLSSFPSPSPSSPASPSLSIFPSRSPSPQRDHCKRAILFLSSSKILTPHPPLPLASLSSTRNKGGRYCTHSPGGEGDGGSIFWKTREIGLPSYNDLSTAISILFPVYLKQRRK